MITDSYLDEIIARYGVILERDPMRLCASSMETHFSLTLLSSFTVILLCSLCVMLNGVR